jgi:hypothetical protein
VGIKIVKEMQSKKTFEINEFASKEFSHHAKSSKLSNHISISNSAEFFTSRLMGGRAESLMRSLYHRLFEKFDRDIEFTDGILGHV